MQISRRQSAALAVYPSCLQRRFPAGYCGQPVALPFYLRATQFQRIRSSRTVYSRTALSISNDPKQIGFPFGIFIKGPQTIGAEQWRLYARARKHETRGIWPSFGIHWQIRSWPHAHKLSADP